MKSVVLLLVAFIAFVTSQEFPTCNPDIVEWFPHPDSCSKFVLCYHGNPLERRCAPGLHFSAEYEQCMPPQLAECDINYMCPEVDDPFDPTFISNSGDCTRYFVCFQGTALPRECAAGLFWDVKHHWCTFPEEVVCDSRVTNKPDVTTTQTEPATTTTTEPTTTTTTEPPTTTTTTTTTEPPTTTTTTTTTEPPTTTTTTEPTTTTTTPTTTQTTTRLPPSTSEPIVTLDPVTLDCPTQSGTSNHPHPNICELYYVCINGIAFLRQCPRGQLFDIVRNICYAENEAWCLSYY